MGKKVIIFTQKKANLKTQNITRQQIQTHMLNHEHQRTKVKKLAKMESSGLRQTFKPIPQKRIYNTSCR